MRIFVLIGLALVSGCYDDTSDLSAHMERVQATTTSQIDPMPEVHPYNHYDYSAFDLRSPFSLPKPEAIQQKIQQMSGCLSPDPRRRKQPLEKYALSDLTMRGTMGDDGVLWALMEASDFTLHRVSIGSYLGLYDGRITEVDGKSVKLVELTPDGAGCWVERETVIKIAQSVSEE
ncbi:pilus assembly protein PilP [Colwellia sp. MSW7]|jgi:type IV pilus assembly protein PilP|uniref:Pilus assembly protein PilP n=1 Tax=Colwellia maritima TaxID=2912588 RepID=A0ABS9X5B7_9GAMM|nr:pilus assembly protein PilP [Colwellia maritima]MCI2284982.1 pilus assembly protein PilP [Colwellia maritima]